MKCDVVIGDDFPRHVLVQRCEGSDGAFDAIEWPLVRQDQDWVPEGAEKSLYLRPFMFSTEVGLGAIEDLTARGIRVEAP